MIRKLLLITASLLIVVAPSASALKMNALADPSPRSGKIARANRKEAAAPVVAVPAPLADDSPIVPALDRPDSSKDSTTARDTAKPRPTKQTQKRQEG